MVTCPVWSAHAIPFTPDEMGGYYLGSGEYQLIDIGTPTEECWVVVTWQWFQYDDPNGNWEDSTAGGDPPESGGGNEGGGYDGGTEVMTFAEDDAVTEPRPTCPAVRSEFQDDGSFNRAKKWCNGESMTATQKARILAATAKIRAKGSVCIGLANVIDSVLSHDDIRSGTSDPAAFSQLDGGVNGWMYIRRQWLDFYYDENHRYTDLTVGPIDLQWILAHEADHLLGNRAPNGEVHLGNEQTTVNSAACGR